MAFIQTEYYSEALRRGIGFSAIIPNDVAKEMKNENKYFDYPMKTLYLLHGYSGNSKDWILGSRMQELCTKYNLAVICLSGENSFYVDKKGAGFAYGKLVGEEIVSYTRKLFRLSEKRQDTFIGGLSMGGFGAIRNGLQYNNTFSKIAALSSALIIHNIKGKKEDFTDAVSDYFYYTATFGNLDQLEASDKNPETIVRKLKAQGKQIPEIYMACGKEDFLLEENRQFHRFLQEQQVEVTYVEDTGTHDWDFWNQYIEKAVQWLLA